MKKLYLKPIVEVQLIAVLDILTVSGEEQVAILGDNLGANSDFKLGNNW